MPTYGLLAQRHPSYDAAYWIICRALYSGGRSLLRNPTVLDAVFPRHNGEEDFVYQERRRRACYIPYPGEILDQIVAGLTSDPVTLAAEPKADAFYDGFVKDCSMPGGGKQSMHQLLREQILTALQCGVAWTLVDLPASQGGAGPAASLADEEAAGARRAYAVPVDPVCVVDWEEDAAGELEFAITHSRSEKRTGIDSGRELVREEWTYYTRTEWHRYAISYPADKPPKETDEIPEVAAGALSHGRVPLVRLILPEGLWAMNKLESIARAHLNLRNATTWGEMKTLFPILAAFLAPPNLAAGGDPRAEDDKRAVNQRVGPGRIMQLAKDDDLRYVGPDPGAWTAAHEDLRDLRDEMHRVVVQMGLSVDNSGAALQRSAESKTVDRAATVELLKALGQYLREHAVAVTEMAERARRDAPAGWTAGGASRFDDATVDALVDQATKLEVVPVPSATFQIERKFLLAKRVLGPDATEELLKKIRAELEANITNENFQAPPRMPPGAGDDGEEEEDDGPEEEDDEDEAGAGEDDEE